MKKIKIVLGDFAYLYHGELRIDELTKFISQLTQMFYLIKWKDQNDDMITIFRQNDLIYCHSICERENICFKLYILEKKVQQMQSITEPLISQENLLKNREIIPQIVQSQENCLSLITLGQQKNQQQQHIEINKNFTTDDEKKQYCDIIVLDMMEEIYPGLKKFLSNPLTKSYSVKPLEPDQIEYKRFQSQYQYKPINFPDQMEQSIQLQHDSEEEPIIHQQQFLKKQESIQIQLDNVTPQQMTPKMNQENLNQEQLFYCDYCSVIIENVQRYICSDPECQDIHFCELCYKQNKEEQLHYHKLTEVK